MGADGLAMQVNFQPQATAYNTSLKLRLFSWSTRILLSLVVNIMYADGLTTKWVTQCGHENIPGHIGIIAACWCYDFVHHQAIHTCDINHTGQSSPCCWKILIYSCNFSMATEMWMIRSYFRNKINYILSLFSLKKYQFGWSLLGAKDRQYCRY